MMGVGTPMATQVKVTVWPREAWMDCWGGVTTWGGTGDSRTGVACLMGSWGRKCQKRDWEQKADGKWNPPSAIPTPPPSPPPASHSLQPNSSLRSGQSVSSSQWKLAGMHRLVETHRNSVGPHSSPCSLMAEDKARWSEHRAVSAGQHGLATAFFAFTQNASKTEPNTMGYKVSCFWHSVTTT